MAKNLRRRAKPSIHALLDAAGLRNHNGQSVKLTQGQERRCKIQLAVLLFTIKNNRWHSEAAPFLGI